MTLANRTTAIQQTQAGASAWIPHLSVEEVQDLAAAAQNAARTGKGKGERDALIIQTIFDGCFRVSEALSLTPNSLRETQGACGVPGLSGRAGNPGRWRSPRPWWPGCTSTPTSTASGPATASLPSSSYGCGRSSTGPLRRPESPSPSMWGRSTSCGTRGPWRGWPRPATPRRCRTSSATSSRMTIRYLKTLSAQESLKINQGVDFRW